LWLDDDHYFDMVDQTRWINHSCDPNSMVEATLDEKGNAWARIVAIRPIRPGEEISYHYAFAPKVAEPCTCGTAACGGWIVDPDLMPELMQRLSVESAASGA
jgi:SET domain-containing protein